MTRHWARRTVAVLGLALAGAILARPAPAHPLHTTITELTYQPAGREVRVVMRVFADDLGAAVARASGGQNTPAAVARYVQRGFALTGPDGRRIPLQWQGMQRQEDLVWIRLQGRAPAGLAGGSVVNTVLQELFSDQVNVVKVQLPKQERTLLFTRGAAPKRLR